MFGVGTDHCQISWSTLGPGEVQVEVSGGDSYRRELVHADGGPGAVLVDGLTADVEHRVAVSGPGCDGTTLYFKTLRRPAGVLLGRVATVSDAHLGAPSTGYFHTLREVPERPVEVTSRCLSAALSEIDEWGAELLVVKGDLVDGSNPDLWETAAEVLSTVDVPTVIVPGNHEYASRSEVDPFVGAAAVGLRLVDHVEAVDVPGSDGRVQVIAANVGKSGADSGQVAHVSDDIVAAAANAPGSSLIAFHQQAMRFPVPTYIPVGIPSSQASQLFRDLAGADAHALVTSGHTHRNRRRTVHGITTTEVGSTRDFPGVWAGYDFYEGGVVQTVRRISEPSCIRWTDFTRRSALGMWAKWAPGSLEDRCFSLDWA